MTFRISPRAAFIVLLIGLIFFGAIAIFWGPLSTFSTAYEPQLKVFSLLLGPVATLIGFYLGYLAKRDFVNINTAQKREFTIKVDKFKESAEQHSAELAERSSLLGEMRARADEATRVAHQKQREVWLAIEELQRKSAAIAKLQADLRRITEGSQQLWKLREPMPFEEFRLWQRDPAAPKVVTFANMKGGVGKTTLSANFAAYASIALGKKVLVLDLDYQGSISNMMLSAADKEVVESTIDGLLMESEADALTRISRAKLQLDPTLSRVWITPASYSLVARENLLLLKWLLNEQGAIDVRYRLAKVILSPSLHSEFDLVVIDTPPRMTIGTLNALVASHYFIVPTALDRLSSEAVALFLTNMMSIRDDLQLDIGLGGIVGMMSRQASLNAGELLALERAREGGQIWSANEDFVCKTTIPRRVSIGDAVGEDVAYRRPEPKQLFDPLFDEICERIGLS